MAENILNEGKETLGIIRDKVMGQEEAMERVTKLAAEEEKNERALSIRKKQVKEEIASTLKERRAGVASSFDEEDAKLVKFIQAENGKRTKVRNGQVTDRIDTETADLKTKNESLAAEAKKLYKDTKTPGFFNSSFFYTFFAPRGIGNFLLCVLLFAIMYFAVPCGIYYFGLGDKRQPLYLVLIYIVCIVVFGGLYLLIHNISTGKYRDTVEKGKKYRAEIRANNRQIKKVSRRIEKDKDDSNYDLGDYDSRIEDLTKQRAELAAKKKEALAEFDNNTKKAITDEITERAEKDIALLEETCANTKKEIDELHVKIKQDKLALSNNYEVFLGKDVMNPDALNRMYALMDMGNIATIQEALTEYRKEKESQQNE